MKTTQSRRCVPELSQNAGKNAILDLDAGIEKWLDMEESLKKNLEGKRKPVSQTAISSKDVWPSSHRSVQPAMTPAHKKVLQFFCSG